MLVSTRKGKLAFLISSQIFLRSREMLGRRQLCDDIVNARVGLLDRRLSVSILSRFMMYMIPFYLKKTYRNHVLLNVVSIRKCRLPSHVNNLRAPAEIEPYVTATTPLMLRYKLSVIHSISHSRTITTMSSAQLKSLASYTACDVCPIRFHHPANPAE